MHGPPTGLWLAFREGTSDRIFPGEDASWDVFQRDLHEVLTDPACKTALANLGITELTRIVSHSSRKGAATLCSSSDCSGGWLVAICRRGDWAINEVMDAYIKECVGGDQTIGRVAAGLDLTADSFAVLPPHFRSGHDELVRAALVKIWGDGPASLVNLPGLTPLLIRTAASLVHGYTWLRECQDRDNQAHENPQADGDNEIPARDTIQLEFEGRLATYNQEQRDIIKRTVAIAIRSRGTIRHFDIGEVELHDGHADLLRPALMKASVAITGAVSFADITTTRMSFEKVPLEITVEGTLLVSCGTFHRRDDTIAIKINADHAVFDCPIYHDPLLLGQLRSIVTTEPSDVITRASGVPLMVAIRRDMSRNHAMMVAKERANDLWRGAAMAEMRQLRSELDPEYQAQRLRAGILDEVHEILMAEANARGIITKENLL